MVNSIKVCIKFANLLTADISIPDQLEKKLSLDSDIKGLFHVVAHYSTATGFRMLVYLP